MPNTSGRRGHVVDDDPLQMGQENTLVITQARIKTKPGLRRTRPRRRTGANHHTVRATASFHPSLTARSAGTRKADRDDYTSHVEACPTGPSSTALATDGGKGGPPR